MSYSVPLSFSNLNTTFDNSGNQTITETENVTISSSGINYDNIQAGTAFVFQTKTPVLSGGTTVPIVIQQTGFPYTTAGNGYIEFDPPYKGFYEASIGIVNSTVSAYPASLAIQADTIEGVAEGGGFNIFRLSTVGGTAQLFLEDLSYDTAILNPTSLNFSVGGVAGTAITGNTISSGTITATTNFSGNLSGTATNATNVSLTGISTGVIYLSGTSAVTNGNYPLQTDSSGHISFSTGTNTLSAGISGGTGGSLNAYGTTGSITGYGTSLTALNIPNGGATIGKTGTALSIPNGNITTGGSVTATGLITSSSTIIGVNQLNNTVTAPSTFSYPSTPLLAQTYDPASVTLGGAAITLTASTVYLQSVWLNAGQVVTNISICCNVAGTAPTTFYVGLYTSFSNSRLAISASSTAFTTGTIKSFAMTSAYTVTNSGQYWIAVVQTGVSTNTYFGVSSADNMVNYPNTATGTGLGTFRKATFPSATLAAPLSGTFTNSGISIWAVIN